MLSIRVLTATATAYFIFMGGSRMRYDSQKTHEFCMDSTRILELRLMTTSGNHQKSVAISELASCVEFFPLAIHYKTRLFLRASSSVQAFVPIQIVFYLYKNKKKQINKKEE